MADNIAVLPYFSVTVPNKTGEGAKLLGALRDAGVNLLGLWAYPVRGKKAQFDLVPADPKLFAKAAKKLKLECGPKQNLICWNGEDRPGAAADAAAKLAAAGIDIHAMQAITSGEGRFGALIQLAQSDIKKAVKILSA